MLLNGNDNGKRERTKFDEHQLRHLERVFNACAYPQGLQREKLARELRLTETKIQVIFVLKMLNNKKNS